MSLETTTLKSVTQIVGNRMSDQSAGHGFDHVARVVRLAKTIHAEAGGDAFVIELAALLHDLGDAKFHAGVERSGEFARAILADHQVEEATIEHVVHIVDNLSFRKREEAQPLSLEGQIVQDADRLDALGAIGVVRTIEYGASIGQRFYAPSGSNAKTGIGHFQEKLFLLRDLMNTAAARRIAGERETFMRAFVDQYVAEQRL